MQLHFDASTVQPFTTGGVCFPLNRYPVEIIKTEPRLVKGSTDKGMLVLTLKTLQAIGEIPVGTEHEYRLNIQNDNEATVRIAYAQLSSVMHVINRLQIQDTNQLVGGQFLAEIGPQAAPNDKYSEIKSVMDFHGNQPGKTGQAAAPPAPPAPPAPAQTPAPSFPPQPSAPAFPPAPTQTAAPAFGQPAAAGQQPWQNGAALPPASASAPWVKQ